MILPQKFSFIASLSMRSIDNDAGKIKNAPGFERIFYFVFDEQHRKRSLNYLDYDLIGRCRQLVTQAAQLFLEIDQGFPAKAFDIQHGLLALS